MVHCSDGVIYVDGERIQRLIAIDATDEVKKEFEVDKWTEYLWFCDASHKKGYERTIEFTGECEIITEQEEGYPPTKKLFIKSIYKGSFTKKEKKI